MINRIVVADPQEDIAREQARQAEAVPTAPGADITPITGLGLVGSEGVDDGGRGAGRSRQEHLGNSAKRSKFGNYILGQTLGEGEFGKVKMGWKKDSSVEVAIKLIRRETLGSNQNRLQKIYREIHILRGLDHPNIVRLHEMVETERHIGIILEYASGGELFDYILNHRYLKDNAARRLFAQLISGVGYLHKKGIVHRDLKLENLLLDRNRNIIITDFGFANTFDPNDELGEEIEFSLGNKDFVKAMGLEGTDGARRGDLMQTSCGSPCYAAPELVVSDSLYTGRKVDVWSCGVILVGLGQSPFQNTTDCTQYAMLAGYLPFDDDPANPEGDNINLLYKYIVSTSLTFPEYVTPHARDLLKRILVPDPRKRADLFEVARHSWLSDYAHVVSFITSSTTTSTDVQNPNMSPYPFSQERCETKANFVQKTPLMRHQRLLEVHPSANPGNIMRLLLLSTAASPPNANRSTHSSLKRPRKSVIISVERSRLNMLHHNRRRLVGRRRLPALPLPHQNRALKNLALPRSTQQTDIVPNQVVQQLPIPRLLLPDSPNDLRLITPLLEQCPRHLRPAHLQAEHWVRARGYHREGTLTVSLQRQPLPKPTWKVDSHSQRASSIRSRGLYLRQIRSWDNQVLGSQIRSERSPFKRSPRGISARTRLVRPWGESLRCFQAGNRPIRKIPKPPPPLRVRITHTRIGSRNHILPHPCQGPLLTMSIRDRATSPADEHLLASRAKTSIPATRANHLEDSRFFLHRYPRHSPPVIETAHQQHPTRNAGVRQRLLAGHERALVPVVWLLDAERIPGLLVRAPREVMFRASTTANMTGEQDQLRLLPTKPNSTTRLPSETTSSQVRENPIRLPEDDPIIITPTIQKPANRWVRFPARVNGSSTRRKSRCRSSHERASCRRAESLPMRTKKAAGTKGPAAARRGSWTFLGEWVDNEERKIGDANKDLEGRKTIGCFTHCFF